MTIEILKEEIMAGVMVSALSTEELASVVGGCGRRSKPKKKKSCKKHYSYCKPKPKCGGNNGGGNTGGGDEDEDEDEDNGGDTGGDTGGGDEGDGDIV